MPELLTLTRSVMADAAFPIMTLAPRGRGEPDTITVTATNEVTVFVTDEVTIFVTKMVETTTSIFETSFIHITHTVTDISTSTKNMIVTETQTLTPTPAFPIIITPSTPTCSSIPMHPPLENHVDPFRVLSIVFGVFILSLIVLMWFLVRRFYKMYRAERVMRKQMQTEGTEMPSRKMAVNEGEMHVVGEE